MIFVFLVFNERKYKGLAGPNHSSYFGQSLTKKILIFYYKCRKQYMDTDIVTLHDDDCIGAHHKLAIFCRQN